MDPPAFDRLTRDIWQASISGYLGLTLETVWRALSFLRRAGLLNFVGNTRRSIDSRA
ncbi:hypothetical protein [Bradyrhizobium sp. 18BD]